MTKIGIISGGGSLPIVIGKNLINKNFKVVFFVIDDFFNSNIYKGLDVNIINLKSAKKIINSLKSRNIDNIIMAGNIVRPSITDLSFDLETFKLAKNLLLNKTGDNDLLIHIKKFFIDNGFPYFDWKIYCPELFVNKDNLTNVKPSTIAKKNLKKALSVFRTFGKLDIGQSLIIQNQIVLGLEAVEGTDNLIIRCNKYKKSGDKGILVKLAKYNQSNILDIPTIGENTINLLSRNDYEGIYLEENNCLIIDKEKIINLANKLNIFISTCNKIE
tara:strand:+ start:226 stop:1044 length:819 start_codon:yes stop_codon:yes gene_type:complete